MKHPELNFDTTKNEYMDATCDLKKALNINT